MRDERFAHPSLFTVPEPVEGLIFPNETMKQ